jgi:hypothetical protein
MRPGHHRRERQSAWSSSLLSPPACLGAGGYDHRHAAADEIGRKRRQPIELIVRIPILGRDVLALDIADFLQAVMKRNGDVPVVIFSGLGTEKSDHRHRRLLRPHRHWPHRRAPEPHDERPAFDHSITSSALSKIDCGTVSPSAFAVLRFTAISNLVGT